LTACHLPTQHAEALGASLKTQLFIAYRKSETLVMLKLLRRFRNDRDGVTIVEYGLVIVLVSATFIVAATDVGPQLNSAFGFIQSRLSLANN
jgi:Flp pilus assembly pilin Flp